MKIDFLCVGFQKCATTTLDAVLRQNQGIVLPQTKEIHLDMWYHKYDDPMNIIESKFFGKDISATKLVGIVDPELDNDPAMVYDCIGKDVKLIFIMRNPVDRLFSFYKMALLLGYQRVYESTLDGEKIQHVRRSFARYVREELSKGKNNLDFERGNYIDKILEFQKYYSKENMKFIIFEEYIRNPEKIINELFSFLQVPYKNIDYDTWEGGGKISKNKICFKINGKLSTLREYARCNPKVRLETYQKFDSICDAIFEITSVSNTEKMDANIRKRLEKYYLESKKRLEHFLDYDLSQIWF